MRRLSFRQKLILTYVAFTLGLIFVTFAGASYYINSLQKSNVQDAVNLAREQAVSMAVAAQEMLASKSSSEMNDPAVKKNLQAITKINLKINKNILWAAVISPDGDRLVTEYGDTPKDSVIQRDETAKDVSNIRLPNEDTLEVEVTAKPVNEEEVVIPFLMDENRQGQIAMRVQRSVTFQRIEESSQRISRALVYGSLLMLIFLLVIYWILWRMFFRQLELQQNNAKLDRMAYVGSLASGLAHEIRNPLSSMNVNLEVIREELDEMDTVSSRHTRELSTRVQREVLQLNNTLTSFLDFALPRKEGYSQFPLRGLVEELLDSHAEELKAREITVELESPPASQTTIEADRRLMHQAIRNILMNAIQVLSSSLKKTIRVEIKPIRNDRIQLSIVDSGPGIQAENLSTIFEVFFSTRKGGSGFGLAIARKIVDEHQGRIWAENNKESLGATFVMELPILAPQEQETPEVGSVSSRRFWGGSMRTKDEMS